MYNLPVAKEVAVIQRRLSPCQAEVSWSFEGEESNLLHFSIIATSTLTNEQLRKDVNPHKRQATLQLKMHTTYRINVVTVYKEGMELSSEIDVEFRTPSDDIGNDLASEGVGGLASFGT